MKTCYIRTNSGPYIAPNTIHTKNCSLQIHVVSQPHSFRSEASETAYMVPMRLTVLAVQSHKAFKPSMNDNQCSTCAHNM